MPQPAQQRLRHISPPGMRRPIHTTPAPTNPPARRNPLMQPNGASDPTTAAERMLEVRALLAPWIAERAIRVHRSSRRKGVLGALCARGHHAGACAAHTNPLVKAGVVGLAGLEPAAHPYQLASNRCADRHSRRSRLTVGAQGMRSIDALVCVLLFRPDACDVAASLTSYPACNSPPSYARECYSNTT
jgi:hypothetical protein